MRLLGSLFFICVGVVLLIISFNTYKKRNEYNKGTVKLGEREKFRIGLSVVESMIIIVIGLNSLVVNIDFQLIILVFCVTGLVDIIISRKLEKKISEE
ncbi:hypothetical protein [Clostridium intestinale]|uniref:hypothetical protein n=1 Tax=Clostridium intestinale TaxID=36845 RepID=UPI002DD667DD|nr:hypothetical protein [Clostridium intestinale]WRY52267.1 hypothetical protein P8F83_03520 [Clostridium intestinale]